ncbi:TPA: hypothetical protein ACK3J3_000064 [Mannheimia haemolytica]
MTKKHSYLRFVKFCGKMTACRVGVSPRHLMIVSNAWAYAHPTGQFELQRL